MCYLAEFVDYSENGGAALGGKETSDEAQGDA